MKKTPEIYLELKTVKVGQYNIDDMKNMFGKRISKAIIENDSYKGLSSKEMYKICKKWKFWNQDICKAYHKYYGLIFAPYVIVTENTINTYGYQNELVNNHFEEYLNKEFYEKIKV